MISYLWHTVKPLIGMHWGRYCGVVVLDKYTFGVIQKVIFTGASNKGPSEEEDTPLNKGQHLRPQMFNTF